MFIFNLIGVLAVVVQAASPPASSPYLCLRGFRDVVRPWSQLPHIEQPKTIDDFLRCCSVLHGIGPADNARFMASLEGMPLYFTWDLSYLQDLNNVVLRSKPLGTAVANYAKEMLLEEMMASPLLESTISRAYSDFKSIRLGLTADTPEVRIELERVFHNVQKHLREVLDQSEVAGKYRDLLGIAPRPDLWHSAGVGTTHSDKANQVARIAFEEQKRLKTPVMPDFLQHEQELTRQLEEVEALRSWVELDSSKLVPATRNFILQEAEPGGKKILSNDLLALIRALRKDGQTDDELAAILAREVNRRYIDSKFDQEFAWKLITYYRRTNNYVASLLQEKRIHINMSRAREGVVSFDFVGLGAENVTATMRELARLNLSDAAEQAVRAARVAEQLVSKQLQAKKDEVARVVDQWDPGTRAGRPKLFFSGDDGIFMPVRELTLEEKRSLVAELTRNKLGSSIRLTFLSKNFRQLPMAIPSRMRSDFIVRAEKIEKDVRMRLANWPRGSGLREQAMGIDYVPGFQGPSLVRVILEPKPDDLTRRLLERALRATLRDDEELEFL